MEGDHENKHASPQNPLPEKKFFTRKIEFKPEILEIPWTMFGLGRKLFTKKEFEQWASKIEDEQFGAGETAPLLKGSVRQNYCVSFSHKAGAFFGWFFQRLLGSLKGYSKKELVIKILPRLAVYGGSILLWYYAINSAVANKISDNQGIPADDSRIVFIVRQLVGVGGTQIGYLLNQLCEYTYRLFYGMSADRFPVELTVELEETDETGETKTKRIEQCSWIDAEYVIEKNNKKLPEGFSSVETYCWRRTPGFIRSSLSAVSKTAVVGVIIVLAALALASFGELETFAGDDAEISTGATVWAFIISSLMCLIGLRGRAHLDTVSIPQNSNFMIFKSGEESIEDAAGNLGVEHFLAPASAANEYR